MRHLGFAQQQVKSIHQPVACNYNAAGKLIRKCFGEYSHGSTQMESWQYASACLQLVFFYTSLAPEFNIWLVNLGSAAKYETLVTLGRQLCTAAAARRWENCCKSKRGTLFAANLSSVLRLQQPHRIAFQHGVGKTCSEETVHNGITVRRHHAASS